MAAWGLSQARGDFGLAQLIRNPAAVDGAEVVLSLARVTTVSPDSLTLQKGRHAFVVQRPPGAVTVGEEVTVVGTFRADDARIEAERVYRAPDRDAKRGLGFLGLGLLALCLPGFFRWTGRGVATRG